MSEPDPPRVTRLLPDAVHQAVSRPGTAVVRLETTHDRKGALDGAWWPRSRDIAGELPDLVSALSEYLGPITRVGLDTDAWDELPTRMTIDGRVVHIDSFPIGDDTVLITRGGNDLFSLLVVPSHTVPDAARAAMAAAVRAGSQTSAEQILIDTGTERVGPGQAPQPALRHGRHEPGR